MLLVGPLEHFEHTYWAVAHNVQLAFGFGEAVTKAFVVRMAQLKRDTLVEPLGDSSDTCYHTYQDLVPGLVEGPVDIDSFG